MLNPTHLFAGQAIAGWMSRHGPLWSTLALSAYAGPVVLAAAQVAVAAPLAGEVVALAVHAVHAPPALAPAADTLPSVIAHCSGRVVRPASWGTMGQ